MKPLQSHRWYTPYAFVLPAMLILCVFVLWSFVQVLILSFTRVDLFAPGDNLLAHARCVGFTNYAQALGSDRFWWCLVNSLFYLLITPVIIVISLIAAMTVTSGVRGLSAIRLLLFLPVITPTIVGSIAWRVLFNEDSGLINRGLMLCDLGKAPWLTGYPWVLITAMTVTLWKGFGYYMMIFVGALMAVSPELEEACLIDGASRAGVFWNVTFPSIRPVVVLVALLSCISALKVFDEIYVTVRNVPATSKTMVPLIFDTAFEQGNFGLACAMGVLLFVIVLAFSLIQLRLTQSK
jgi:putative chitobiose transport system permease protein